ncbi:hypothetical protein R1sor_011315 [Riccia sorocarpa]|uniref:Uncharacterized protein n=1 Tax=Riccia sorocarpa TaxID=122646 RepID=A0ABD3I2C8_9MARC
MVDMTGDGEVLDAAQLQKISAAWVAFSEMSDSLLQSGGGVALLWSELDKAEWENSVQVLGKQGLAHLVAGHFLDALERNFKQEVVPKFLQHFADFPKLKSASKQSTAGTSKVYIYITAGSFLTAASEHPQVLLESGCVTSQASVKP